MPEEESISRKRIARPFHDEELQLEAATVTTTATPMVQTYPETNPVQPHNPTPKIAVLGSTGKIGRHIIRNLMSMNQEMKIVAFVRDYERACEVLYDDLIRENTSRKGKPILQLVVMDLVQPHDVAGYYNSNSNSNANNSNSSKKRSLLSSKRQNEEDEDDEDDDDNDDEDEKEYAVPAARFYNENVQDYDFRRQNNKHNKNDDLDYIDPYQPLYDSITNATAIISTLGTIRETIPFSDYLFKRWKIFSRPDIWCTDASHPYYLNYMVMKKVLDCAEREQLKRDREWDAWYNEHQGGEQYDEDDDNENGYDYEYDDDDDDDNIKGDLKKIYNYFNNTIGTLRRMIILF